MPLFEVGDRYTATEMLCEGRNEDEIKQNCNYTVQPGAVYEIRISLKTPIKPDDVSKMYDVFKQLEQEYHQIGVNYIMISDDGSEIVFQVFDPPPEARLVPVVVAVIVILVLSIILGIVIYLIVDKVTVAWVKTVSLIPQAPSWTAPLIWGGVAAILIGSGVYLFSKAVRWR